MEVSGSSSSCSGVYNNKKGRMSDADSVQWRVEESIGGNRAAVEALRELVSFPLMYTREARKLGIEWPGGLLLYGPPGTGKTSLVRAVVRECNAHLTTISPHSVHKAHAGESQKILREAFSEASAQAKSGKPSVIFIDEIDVLCPRRDSRREQDVCLASQLFKLMDSNRPSSTPGPHVIVVASTNRVDAVDPALRRFGRFDDEIEVTTPCEEERLQILQLYTKKLLLDSSVDLKSLAASCNGYVGADLEALCREAMKSALKRSSGEDLNGAGPLLKLEDWECARSIVGPSITRGITVEIPKVSWDDIGGLKDLKRKLQQAVEWPIKHPTAFSRLGITPVGGVLLHGPPGCSKTTLAKAVANAAQASFFSLSGAELYSMYVGEGEALLRNTFRRARLAAPSIIFFDEADVVAGKRGGKSGGNTSVGERLLSTLLTEMDGLEQAKGILVLAATNRPQAIDAALLRPGRFDLKSESPLTEVAVLDVQSSWTTAMLELEVGLETQLKVLYVPPPDTESRYEILRVHTRNMEIASDVDLRKLAEDTELFTGAELEGLCREAGIVALREDIHASSVHDRHFQAVRQSLKPALTKAEIDSYASFLKAGPSSRNSMSTIEESRAGRGGYGSKSWNFLRSVSLVKLVTVGLLLVTVAAKYILGNVDQTTRGRATT